VAYQFHIPRIRQLNDVLWAAQHRHESGRPFEQESEPPTLGCENTVGDYLIGYFDADAKKTGDATVVLRGGCVREGEMCFPDHTWSNSGLRSVQASAQTSRAGRPRQPGCFRPAIGINTTLYSQVCSGSRAMNIGWRESSISSTKVLSAVGHDSMGPSGVSVQG
jgi:hypothetical protein